MDRLINQKEFKNALENYINKKEDAIRNYLETTIIDGYSKTEELVIVKGLNLKNIDFWGINFEGFQFKNCKFKNCEFHHFVSIGACIFKDCEFISTDFHDVHFSECDFINTVFLNCHHAYNIFGDCLFTNSTFQNSKEMIEIYFGGCKMTELSFNNCYICHSRFEDFREAEGNTIRFLDSILETTYFFQLDLKDTTFVNSVINLCSYSNCSLSSHTIARSTKSTAKEYSSIDFQTIINSSNISGPVLNQCFGIQNSDIKEYLIGLTTKIEFQSVFISYSFKDRIFAKRLNDALKNKGVFTFLWELDAPGGKGVKRIMRENIQKHDRILFIASENSIRSKACQFELSEGRKKQEELWTDIFFPIHIDNYLFTVEKEEIKPKSLQSEYWENISALKDINSLDFCAFNRLEYNQDQFDDLVFKLVKALKK
jgi:uncharacterized protein YjbI with pentapeptide repeats